MEIALATLVLVVALLLVGGWVYFQLFEVGRIRKLIKELMSHILKRDRDGLYSTLPPSGFRRVSFFKQQARLQKVHFNEELEAMLDAGRDFPRDLRVSIVQILPLGLTAARAVLIISSTRADIDRRITLPFTKEKGKWFVSWRSGLARRLSHALGWDPEPVSPHNAPPEHEWRD